jgi:polar amino acid transport system substrate-binding protein
MRRFWISLVLAAIFSLPGQAEPPLRVALTGVEPFLKKTDVKDPQGICPLVWQACSKRLNLTSTYALCQSEAQAFEMLHSGQVDLVVGPLQPAAEHIHEFDYTLPYLSVTLAALSRSKDATLYDRLHHFFTSAALAGGVSLALLVVTVGVTIWLLERRQNPDHFPPNAIEGMEEGVWFAITTATSVGYGDRFPITRMGRFVTMVWMVVAGLAFSTAVALLSTALTLRNIPSPTAYHLRDLQGSRVALIRNGLAQQSLRGSKCSLYLAQDLTEAVSWLKQGRVHFVVAPNFALEYAVRANHLESEFHLQELIGHTETLSFALPKHHPLTDRLNLTLLELSNSGELQEIPYSWFQI